MESNFSITNPVEPDTDLNYLIEVVQSISRSTRRSFMFEKLSRRWSIFCDRTRKSEEELERRRGRIRFITGRTRTTGMLLRRSVMFGWMISHSLGATGLFFLIPKENFFPSGGFWGLDVFIGQKTIPKLLTSVFRVNSYELRHPRRRFTVEILWGMPPSECINEFIFVSRGCK